MFGHSTAALRAQMLPVFEVLERRYCFSTAVNVESGMFADPTAFREPLEVKGLDTSIFVSGFDKEGANGSELSFNSAPSSTGGDELFSIGKLIFRNLETYGGEAASVNLVLTLTINGKVQTITVPLGIDNTWNTDDPVESRDSIFLDAGPIVGDVFEVAAGQRMALVIFGFKADGETTIGEEFFGYEETEVTTQVMAGFVPEDMLDLDWLRSSDVAAWQAGQQDWDDDSDDNSDSDDSGNDAIDDNGDDEWEDDMGDEAWDIDLGN
jgi:hypothetical protein